MADRGEQTVMAACRFPTVFLDIALKKKKATLPDRSKYVLSFILDHSFFCVNIDFQILQNIKR